ncbi:MAG: transposase [Candidatus Competibacteraceae bacterium]|nr:transposase [Candidatus Competibacteraceae bacterium]
MKIAYTDAFREQAVTKAYHRGDRTIHSIATELDVKYHTLKNWMKSPKAKTGPAGDGPRRARDWSAAQRLHALLETHELEDQPLSAWCRQHGVYPHHLQAWREAFEHADGLLAPTTRGELRDLKDQNKHLERELKRKEKALAETAALLVLQKKFQALWEDQDE